MSKANDLTKSIVTFLNLSGWKVWRQNNVGIFDTKKNVFRSGNNLKGVSDIRLGIFVQFLLNIM